MAHTRGDDHKLRQVGKTGQLMPIPGEGRYWPFIEAAVLEVTKIKDGPAAPLWSNEGLDTGLDGRRNRDGSESPKFPGSPRQSGTHFAPHPTPDPTDQKDVAGA